MAVLPLRSLSRLSPKDTFRKTSGGRIALFFALVVSITVVSSSASPSVSHALNSGGLAFQDFDETGESWAVTGCDGACADPVVIPSIVNGKPVVGIGSSAFWFDSTLAEVQIPASVTTIASYAFGGSRATAFSVDSSSEHFKSVSGMLLTKDGTELVAYPGGALATSATVPTGVKKLRMGSFYSGPVTSVSLPTSLEVIEQQAFYLPGLLTIELPISLSTIGVDAFGESLTSFTVNAGNITFRATDGVLFKGSTLLRYPPARSATSYVVPSGTTDIEPFAFDDTSLLNSLDLPASISTLQGASLNGLSNLASITVNAGNSTFSAIDGVLFKGSTLIKYPNGKGTTYSVPAGTTEIEESAFKSSPTLTTITLPDSVTVIGTEAFAYSPNLTSINLPSGLVSLGTFSFIYTRITSIVVPHTVTNWGYQPFGYNSNDPGTSFNFYFEGDAPPESALGLPSGSIIHRIEGTNGWPALSDTYLGYTQAAWSPNITTPRAPSVSALVQSVRVTANRGSGGLPTSYLVTASPEERTCTIAAGETSCVVTGLTSGTPYTFTTKATKGATTTASSAASTAVNPLTSQTITFADPTDREFSTTPFTVTATSNSNLPVTLTSTTQDVCTVTSFEVSMLTPGTCALTASQAGDTTYAAATDIEQSFTISAAQAPPIETPPAETPPAEVAPVVTTAPAVVAPVVTTAPAVVAPVVTTAPAVVAPVVTTTPPIAMIVAAKPVISVVGTSVSISREPSAAVATAVAIGVRTTKVMLALQVPKASKPGNQVTKYVIQLKSAKGVIITKTISVKAGATVKPTLTGKKKTSYSMTVTAVTKSGKKTTWKGPQVKTS
jgi:hypothetical protein